MQEHRVRAALVALSAVACMARAAEHVHDERLRDVVAVAMQKMQKNEFLGLSLRSRTSPCRCRTVEAQN